jgi:hypothetical protein
VPGFVLPFSTLDSAYLPGMEYDCYLREKYGLENEIQCIGAPTTPPGFVIPDEQRQSKAAIGEYLWFDINSEVTKNMHIVAKRGSIELLARRDSLTR